MIHQAMHAQFRTWTAPEYPLYVFLEDTGTGAVRSVSNDAEYVVRTLIATLHLTAENQIFYRDSGDQWDQLLHNGKEFTGFMIWGASSEDEVIAKFEASRKGQDDAL